MPTENPSIFAVNRFCEFSNRDTEREFLAQEKERSLGTARALILIMGIIFMAFVFSDFFYYGGGRAAAFSLAIRSLVLGITLAFFFLSKRIGPYNITLIVIFLTQLIIFSLYLLNLQLLEASQVFLQFMTVALFLISAYLIPNHLKNSFILSLCILGAYLAYCAAFQDPALSPPLHERGIYLGVTLIACAIFTYSHEKSRRERFEAEKLLEINSITDKLTGVANRGRFEHVLGLWIKNKRHEPFCLLFFDIDNFKSVNDRYGHSLGDEVLIQITQTVTANIRDEDTFARWGGEEFVILFSNIGIAKATELAERLRAAVEAVAHEKAGVVTISIGVVQYRQGETLLDLVHRGDTKMYEAKQAGKNRVVSEE
ncbi:MAG: GGDEF domain-containing protein [Treponema sp.]|nr:GGDEF domain-containing protein [Treponema sp.]